MKHSPWSWKRNSQTPGKVLPMSSSVKLFRGPGVYVVRNNTNGKGFLGFSQDLYKRNRDHASLLVNNRHFNEALQADWNASDGEGFEFAVLKECTEIAVRDEYAMAVKEYKHDLYNNKKWFTKNRR